MADELSLPLVGLLSGVVLPHEERELPESAFDAATLESVRALFPRPERLLVLPIDSSLQLPSYVSSRWGTECQVLELDGADLRLRGIQPVKVRQVYGKKPPLTAAVIPADEEKPLEVLEGGHALLAALEVALREIGSPEELSPPIGLVMPILRALQRVVVAEEKDLRASVAKPLGELLNEQGERIAGRIRIDKARRELLGVMEKLKETTEISKGDQTDLAGLVTEIQKRLGLYEPLVEDELGDDLTRLQRKLERANMPAGARRVAKRELRMLRDMAKNHHDYSVYVQHLSLMAELPWHSEPLGAIDLPKAREVLDAHHFGLEEPKKRILEYLAVRAKGGKARGVVLCLAGPPGVGKTTLARRIAEGLGRKFERVSLGGIHEESEIRGHRLTFLASAPGRIIRAIHRVHSRSAVVLLDEIDKIGSSTWRSPAGALLEVLDPEQNTTFEDNHLAVPFDLSEVFFICTANEMDKVMPTLRDRLEVVDLEGYTAAEKEQIARRHLLRELAEEHGFEEPLALADEALRRCIEGYTREAGVRQLNRRLAKLYRGRAVRELSGEELPATVELSELEEVLGPPRYRRQKAGEPLPPGVVLGLSVSSGGGALLYIEVGKVPGIGELKLTGQLGDVLKEAAQVALGRLRIEESKQAFSERVGGISITDRFKEADFHIHLPEGATPKEGPSAGVALYLALLSAVSDKPIRSDVAFTGEITLRGAVLPVGGVKAKALAAERAGLSLVVLPEENRADLPKDLKIEARFVSRVEELWDIAFADGESKPRKQRKPHRKKSS
jgi:ATP-dependent Lon protease